MFNEEFFILIEKSGPAGITAQEIASHIGLNKKAVAARLSKWKAEGYLKLRKLDKEGDEYKRANRAYDRPRIDGKPVGGRAPGTAGRYYIDDECKEWHLLRYQRLLR